MKKNSNGSKLPDYDFSIIRELRTQRNMSLEKLAEKTELSYPTLARIESNKNHPNLGTLKKLSAVFGMTPAHLLELCTSFIVERKKEHKVKVEPGYRRAISFPGLRQRIGTGRAGEFTDKGHQHIDDYQIIWVLEGCIVLNIHNEEHRLKRGHSIKFDAGYTHSIRFIEDTEFVVSLIPKKIK